MGKSVELNLYEPMRDEEEILADLEKEHEEQHKELMKNLKDKVKVVDEINLQEKLILSEAPIPNDLAQAYKRSRYLGGTETDGDNPDLHRAEYTEVTPDEALRLIKKEGRSGDLRLLINGKLVKMEPSGNGMTDDRFRVNVSSGSAYINKGGKVIMDTKYMPAKHILSIADKIYLTNESTPEGQKDVDLLAQRKSSTFDRDITYRNEIIKTGGRGSKSINTQGYSYDRAVRARERATKEYKETKDNLDNQLKSGYISNEEYKNEISKARDKMIRSLEYWSEVYRHKDYEARKRYSDSEHTLHAPIAQYKELKNDIDWNQRSLTNAQNTLNDIQANGSDRTRRIKRDIDRYKEYIKDYMIELARLEANLDMADEDDAAALAQAQAAVNDITTKIADAKAGIDKLLRKTEGFNAATRLVKLIESKNLLEDFEDIVDTLSYEDDADLVMDMEESPEMFKEMLGITEE